SSPVSVSELSVVSQIPEVPLAASDAAPMVVCTAAPVPAPTSPAVAPGQEWLKVESLDIEAQGIAHRADGKVVFIEDALPGEEVQVKVARRKNNWEQGAMTAMRRESAQRVTPRCTYFGLCGGCKMQHFHPSAQVAV